MVAPTHVDKYVAGTETDKPLLEGSDYDAVVKEARRILDFETRKQGESSDPKDRQVIGYQSQLLDVFMAVVADSQYPRTTLAIVMGGLHPNESWQDPIYTALECYRDGIDKLLERRARESLLHSRKEQQTART